MSLPALPIDVRAGEVARLALRLKDSSGAYIDLSGRTFSWAVMDGSVVTIEDAPVVAAASIETYGGVSTAIMTFAGDVTSALMPAAREAKDFGGLLVETITGGYRTWAHVRLTLRRGPSAEDLRGEEGEGGPPAVVVDLTAEQEVFTLSLAGADGRSAKQIAIDAGDIQDDSTDSDFTTWLRSPAVDAATAAAAAVAAKLAEADAKIAETETARGNAQQAADDANTEVTGGLAQIDTRKQQALDALAAAEDDGVARLGETLSGAELELAGARDDALGALDDAAALEVAGINSAGDAKLAQIALAAYAGGRVYTTTGAAEADAGLAVGAYYMLLGPGISTLYLKQAGPTSTSTGFSLVSDADPIRNLRLALARYDHQVTSGQRTYPVNQVLPTAWALTNVVRNADGSFTGQAGGTMVVTLTSADWIGPGNRFAYVVRHDTALGSMTIDVFSTQGNTVIAAASSTVELVPGLYRLAFNNALSRNPVRITITFVEAGDIADPEISLTDSAYLPAILRHDEAKAVPQKRLMEFEFWRNWRSEFQAHELAVEKHCDVFIDQPNGNDNVAVVNGSITNNVFAITGVTSGTPGGGQTVTNGGALAGTRVERQSSGPAGGAGNYLVNRNHTAGTGAQTFTLSSGLTIATPKKTLITAGTVYPIVIDGTSWGLLRGGVFREDLAALRVTSHGPYGVGIHGVGAIGKPFPEITSMDPVVGAAIVDNGDGTYQYAFSQSAAASTTILENGYSELPLEEISLALEAAGKPVEASRPLKRCDTIVLKASFNNLTMTVTKVGEGQSGETFAAPTNSPAIFPSLYVGMPINATGVAPGTTITSVPLGNGLGDYGISAPHTLSSRTVTVLQDDMCRFTPGTKYVTDLGGGAFLVKWKPSAGVTVGVTHRYQIGTRWCPLDWGDYTRQGGAASCLFLRGSSWGYGALAGCLGFSGDRLVFATGNTHNFVIPGGLIQRSMIWGRGTWENNGTFYANDGTNSYWGMDQFYGPENYSCLYAHVGAGGNHKGGFVRRGVVYGPGRLPNGALVGSGPGGVSTEYIVNELNSFRGGRDSGIQLATVKSTMKDVLRRQIAFFYPNHDTRDVVVCMENCSDPNNVNNRFCGVVMRDATSLDTGTLIFTNTANTNGLSDYAPSVFQTTGSIVTKPVIRRQLIILCPQLATSSLIMQLKSDGSAPIDLDYCTFVMGPGSSYQLGQDSGATTNTLAELLSRSGQNAHGEFLDFRGCPNLIDRIFVNFAAGDLRYRQTREAYEIDASCQRTGAGAPWTIAAWPAEPGPDEFKALLEAA